MGFPTKHPSERLYAGTDWTTAPLAAGETIVSATVTVGVIRGTDANPSAIVSGAAVVNSIAVTVTENGIERIVAIGKLVSQFIIDGVRGVVYETRWVVLTSLGRTLERRVELVVE